MNLIYDKEGKGRGRNVFVVKLLRDQICASLGSSWVVKHQLTCTWCEIWIGQGFDSSPSANQVKSLSWQHKQQFQEGKGKPFICTGRASSHSRGTEEVIQVRKCPGWRCEKRTPGVCPGHKPDDSPGSLQLFPSWIQQPWQICTHNQGPQIPKEQYTLQLWIPKHWVVLINQPTQCLWQQSIFKIF